MLNKTLPDEMLALADALRHVREQIAFLVHAQDERITGHPETQTVLGDGLEVAAALEHLAERLAATK